MLFADSHIFFYRNVKRFTCMTHSFEFPFSFAKSRKKTHTLFLLCFTHDFTQIPVFQKNFLSLPSLFTLKYQHFFLVYCLFWLFYSAFELIQRPCVTFVIINKSKKEKKIFFSSLVTRKLIIHAIRHHLHPNVQRTLSLKTQNEWQTLTNFDYFHSLNFAQKILSFS